MTLPKKRFVSGNREQLAWIFQVGCSFFAQILPGQFGASDLVHF